VTVADTGFRDVAATLLREAFEGIPSGQNYTWFVQGKEGLFDALSAASAEEASRQPNPGCPSIAAHANHILYILRSANTSQGQAEPEGTWEDTWKVQAVTDSEWASLVERIRCEYESFLAWFRGNEDWSGEFAIFEGLAPLPHVAYHLGAIRQLLKVLDVG